MEDPQNANLITGNSLETARRRACDPQLTSVTGSRPPLFGKDCQIADTLLDAPDQGARSGWIVDRDVSGDLLKVLARAW